MAPQPPGSASAHFRLRAGHLAAGDTGPAGVPTAEALARVLARQQLLLMLDNCEHVIGAAAARRAGLLVGADDVRVLATSREGRRYRRRSGRLRACY